MLSCIVLMSTVALYLKKNTLLKITTSLSLQVTRKKYFLKKLSDADII